MNASNHLVKLNHSVPYIACLSSPTRLSRLCCTAATGDRVCYSHNQNCQVSTMPLRALL
ncbi:hypothetical protein Bpfe_011216, partial [Biomphalaria pfeifferi]